MKQEEKKPNFHAGHRQRLREKYDADRELTAFQEHEILEYILSLVIPRKDTNELAHEIIHKYGSLHNVFMCTPKDLLEFKNMTTTAAYLLAAIYPAVRRSLRTTNTFDEAMDVGNYARLSEYMQPKFIGRKTECLSVLYLNCKYKVLFNEWIEGCYSEKIKLNTDAIVKRAVKEGAKFVVFAHNHPSQDLSPSFADIQETSTAYGRLASVGVELLDSLIFADAAFTSFRSNGIISKCEDDYYHKFLTGKDSLENPKTYESFYYRSRFREFILDYNKFKKKGEIEMVDSHYELTDESKGDPRNKPQ